MLAEYSEDVRRHTARCRVFSSSDCRLQVRVVAPSTKWALGTTMTLGSDRLDGMSYY